MKLPEATDHRTTERINDRVKIQSRNSLSTYHGKQQPPSVVLAPSSNRKQVGGGKTQSRPTRVGTTEFASKWGSSKGSKEGLVKPSGHKSVKKCDETFSVNITSRQRLGSKILKSAGNQSKSTDTIECYSQQILNKKDEEIMSLKEELASLITKSSQVQSSKFEYVTKNGELEEKLELQNDAIRALKENMTKLKSEIYDLKNEVENKSTELIRLRSGKLKTNAVLERFLPFGDEDMDKQLEVWMEEKNNELKQSKEENWNLMKAIKKLEIAQDFKEIDTEEFKEPDTHQLTEDGILEKETALFMERVSSICRNKSRKIKASSKDENIKINLKITARKGNLERVPNRLSLCEAESPGTFLKTPCQTFSVKEDIDSVLREKLQVVNACEEELDHRKMLPNPCPSLTSEGAGGFQEKRLFTYGSPSGLEGLNVNLNDNCRASLGTIGRAEDLDLKLQELWTRMSSQEETLEQLKSEKRRFTFSVDLLEEELSESRTQHMNLVEQVNVVKKLFN